jgi:hypothetical protein
VTTPSSPVSLMVSRSFSRIPVVIQSLTYCENSNVQLVDSHSSDHLVSCFSLDLPESCDSLAASEQLRMATAARMATCELRQARLSIPRECHYFENSGESADSCVEHVVIGVQSRLRLTDHGRQSVRPISSAVVFLFGLFQGRGPAMLCLHSLERHWCVGRHHYTGSNGRSFPLFRHSQACLRQCFYEDVVVYQAAQDVRNHQAGARDRRSFLFVPCLVQRHSCSVAFWKLFVRFF